LALILVVHAGDGRTPLHAAADTGNVEIAQLLLEAGDDPNTMASDGFAPLHRACRGEGLGHTEVVELLLKHGVSVSAAAANGKTPIELVRYNRDTRERLQHELRRHGEL
jgi:ankyrin repeat protein